MDHITALKRAVEMLEQIAQGHSYDSQVYLELRQTSTQPFGINSLSQLALDNGIVITDWVNADSLRCHFPDVLPEGIPTLLIDLSTHVGDYPCPGDVSSWIAEAADRQNIDLNSGEKPMNLSQFTGTENYYIHPLVSPHIRWTDGVNYFIKNAGCGAYWFLDIVLTEIAELHKQHDFLALTFSVTPQSRGVIKTTDGRGTLLWSKNIAYTDTPTGDYWFFMVDNVFLLTSEY